jgi:uncharacterized protein YbjQ (UPF0145 family)
VVFSFLNRRKDAKIKELIDGNSYEDLPIDVISSLGSHIVVTTEQAPSGMDIGDRLGVVSAEIPVALHLLRPLLQRSRKHKSGRTPAGQRVLREARQTCETEIRREALILGADAVIGVSVDCRQLSGLGRQTLLVTLAGTAVKLRKPEPPVLEEEPEEQLNDPPPQAKIAALGD